LDGEIGSRHQRQESEQTALHGDDTQHLQAARAAALERGNILTLSLDEQARHRPYKEQGQRDDLRDDDIERQ
jgi:hypothetical protein